jgi:protein-disulfide isomerase
MDRRFWAIIGVIVVVFGGILVFNNKNSDNNGTDSGNAKPSSHLIGNPAAKVTLVEYGDYECPVCENYYAVVQQVQQKYNDTVQLQFRNLPLSQIHPNAVAGARAAEAADKQGKFWEMHDLLYTPQNWNEWSTSNNTMPFFRQYAKSLKLNMTQFEKDFASRAVNSRINADVNEFDKTHQEKGTPSFFVNGKYVKNTNFVDSTTGQPSVDAFSKVLDKALADTK